MGSCPGSFVGTITVVGDSRKTRASSERCFVGSDVLWIELVARSISQGAEKEECSSFLDRVGDWRLESVSLNGELYTALTF